MPPRSRAKAFSITFKTGWKRGPEKTIWSDFIIGKTKEHFSHQTGPIRCNSDQICYYFGTRYPWSLQKDTYNHFFFFLHNSRPEGRKHWVIRRVVNRKPKVGVFGRVFFGFATENRLYIVGFSVAQKNRNRKTDWVFFRSVYFSCPLRKKSAYVSVWKPRYGWTRGQLRHTAAAVGVGRLNTSTYYTVYSTIGRFKIHCSSIIGSLACRTPLPLGWTVSSRAMIQEIIVLGLCYVLQAGSDWTPKIVSPGIPHAVFSS